MSRRKYVEDYVVVSRGTVVVTLSLLLDGDDAMTVAQVLRAL